jgi:hypothetical protein
VALAGLGVLMLGLGLGLRRRAAQRATAGSDTSLPERSR